MPAGARAGRWRRVSFWLSLALPVGLLALIVAGVDLPAVLRNVRQADVGYALGALLTAFLIPIALLVWRWQWILRHFYGVRVAYRFLLAEYWIAMFAGYWVPAGVGSDVYRALRVGKAAGGVPVNTAAVVGEKVWSLLAYGILVLVSYPLVAASLAARPQLRQAVFQIAVFSALAVAALVLALLLKDPVVGRLRRALEGKLMDRLGAMAQGILRAAAAGDDTVTFPALLSPFFRWRNQALGLGVTIVIQLLTTLGGRLLLLALGVDLPYVVHLFVWALMNFFMLLPVSIAGFGVREASFILLFGLFGVSRETSLAASFLSLACTLAAIAPGGVVWLSRAFDRSTGPLAGAGPET